MAKYVSGWLRKEYLITFPGKIDSFWFVSMQLTAGNCWHARRTGGIEKSPHNNVARSQWARLDFQPFWESGCYPSFSCSTPSWQRGLEQGAWSHKTAGNRAYQRAGCPSRALCGLHGNGRVRKEEYSLFPLLHYSLEKPGRRLRRLRRWCCFTCFALKVW